MNKYQKEYRDRNKDKILEYRKKNKEKIILYAKEYREKNKEKLRKKSKKYYNDNREYLLDYRRDYYLKNKEKMTEYFRNYRKEHKEEIKINKNILYKKKKAKNNKKLGVISNPKYSDFLVCRSKTITLISDYFPPMYLILQYGGQFPPITLLACKEGVRIETILRNEIRKTLSRRLP